MTNKIMTETDLLNVENKGLNAHNKAYIFMGSPITDAEHGNLAIFTDCLSETNPVIVFVNDFEPAEDLNYCTRKSLGELQTFIDKEELEYFGNTSKENLDNTIFCIIETDKEKRIQYLKEINDYAGGESVKIIFLTYLDSLFLEKLKEHDLKLDDALYVPYISTSELDAIGIHSNWELYVEQTKNQTKLKGIYGEIIELFQMDFIKDYVTFTVGLHTILLKNSMDYLTWCFQQHIIKYGTIVNLTEGQINEVMESFGFDTSINIDGRLNNTIVLPDSYDCANVLTQMVLPKHSIISAAVVSESNRVDDIGASAAKIIISNNISKIGIFGIPEGKTIHARFINNLTNTLNLHVHETSLSQEPFKYTLYLIDHCNETINTPEESIQTDFGFGLAIICDNKYFTYETPVDPGTPVDNSGAYNIGTYLEDAKKKYITLDINTGVVYNPVKKIGE